MQNVIMQSVIMLSVIMLSVIMLSVMVLVIRDLKLQVKAADDDNQIRKILMKGKAQYEYG